MLCAGRTYWPLINFFCSSFPISSPNCAFGWLVLHLAPNPPSCLHEIVQRCTFQETDLKKLLRRENIVETPTSRPALYNSHVSCDLEVPNALPPFDIYHQGVDLNLLEACHEHPSHQYSFLFSLESFSFLFGVCAVV